MISFAPTAPLREDVIVQLGADPIALDTIATVVDALEAADYHRTAETFLTCARRCDTDEELLLLARCTVTVL